MSKIYESLHQSQNGSIDVVVGVDDNGRTLIYLRELFEPVVVLKGHSVVIECECHAAVNHPLHVTVTRVTKHEDFGRMPSKTKG